MDFVAWTAAGLGLGLYFYEKLQTQKLKKQVFELSVEKRGLEVEKKALEEMEKTFRYLSQQVLDKNTDHFIKTADSKQSLLLATLAPVKESLDKLSKGLDALEKERKGDHEGLKTQLKLLKESEVLLKEQTGALVSALKNPVCRGAWGEMQLRRVLEVAGMMPHCDFLEQEVLKHDKLRPDVIVKLSGGRSLVIDAKAPLEAFLEAASAETEEGKELKLKEHAARLRDHILALSKKSYFEALEQSIELVVLFLPQESLFSQALSVDPTLIELGAKNQVVIATPTTLLALLKAVAYGWKQETLSLQVEAVKTLGKELYKRLADLTGHFNRLGKNLNGAVEAYNKTLGSLESRVIVSARKFEEMGIETVDSKELQVEPISLLAKEPVCESDCRL